MSELSRRSFLRAGGLAATAALGLAEGCTNARPKPLPASMSTGAYENRLYLDPVFEGSYPSDVVDDLAKQSIELPVHDGDLKTISTAVDLLGVNYYNPLVVGAGGVDVRKYPTTQAPGSRSIPLGSAIFWCRQRRVTAIY